MQYQQAFLKKLTLISLLLILVLSQCGYYCIYTYQTHIAKIAAHEQMLKQIPENLLIKICVQENAANIQWEEEGKELRLQGEMYDVVKEKIENGKKYLFCISDKKEDEVQDALASAVKNSTDNTSGSGKSPNTVKLIISEWIFELNNDIHQQIKVEDTKKKYSHYNSPLYSWVVEINAPPPNFYI